MATLTPAGLTISRFPEIQSIIQNALQQNISSSLIFDEDTILGQVVNIIANELATLETIIQTLNDSKDRDKAENEQLDALLYLLGLERQSAAASSGFVQFTAEENVTVPLDTIVENPSTGDRFRSTNSVTATQSAHLEVVYKLTDVLNSTNYIVTVNGVDYSYTSTGAATHSEILLGIVGAIEDGNNPAYTASVSLDNGVEYLKIQSKSRNNISTNVLQYFEVKSLKISVPFECTEEGRINVPEGTVTRLVTGVGGVTFLRNNEAFGVGRLRETDTEFRLRASEAVAISGSATYSALFTALRNIEGVGDVVLIENNTLTTDVDGVPGKAFEAIVDVPNTEEYNQSVAVAIWNEKPIGIESYGTQQVEFTDEIGATRSIFFSRPESVFVALKFTYTLDSEGTPPANLSDAIKLAAVEYGQTLSSGQNVRTQRFAAAVMSNVSGLETVLCEAQVLPTEGSAPVPGSWSTTTIQIAPRETAAFNQLNVEVVEV